MLRTSAAIHMREFEEDAFSEAKSPLVRRCVLRKKRPSKRKLRKISPKEKNNVSIIDDDRSGRRGESNVQKDD